MQACLDVARFGLLREVRAPPHNNCFSDTTILWKPRAEKECAHRKRTCTCPWPVGKLEIPCASTHSPVFFNQTLFETCDKEQQKKHTAHPETNDVGVWFACSCYVRSDSPITTHLGSSRRSCALTCPLGFLSRAPTRLRRIGPTLSLSLLLKCTLGPRSVAPSQGRPILLSENP